MPIKPNSNSVQQLLDNRPLPEFLNDWITEAQLIQWLGISYNTLKNHRSLEKVSYSRFLGITMYYVPDLEEVLRSNMVRKKAS